MSFWFKSYEQVLNGHFLAKFVKNAIISSTQNQPYPPQRGKNSSFLSYCQTEHHKAYEI